MRTICIDRAMELAKTLSPVEYRRIDVEVKNYRQSRRSEVKEIDWLRLPLMETVLAHQFYQAINASERLDPSFRLDCLVVVHLSSDQLRDYERRLTSLRYQVAPVSTSDPPAYFAPALAP